MAGKTILPERAYNVLLDIGPTADGRIPVIHQQRLIDIGNWLDVNGEAIYESRKWKGSADNVNENVYFTQKDNNLYVLCTEFPKEAILVKGVKKAGEITMLGFNGKIKSKKSGNNHILSVPDISPGNFKGNMHGFLKSKTSNKIESVFPSIRQKQDSLLGLSV